MIAGYTEYLIHISYLLTVSAFLMRNIFWLRMFALSASIVAILYAFNLLSEPLWVPILWHCIFIFINAFQIFLALCKKRKVKLNLTEQFLAKTVLSNFSSAEVKNFVNIANSQSALANTQLIIEGQELKNLYFMMEGSATILSAKEKIAQLTAGYFIGEMSLLTQSAARADVVTDVDCKFLNWSHEKIDQWVGEDAQRLSMLQASLGTQIVEVLMKRSLPEIIEEKL